jgi:circadian clock protein KaiC
VNHRIEIKKLPSGIPGLDDVLGGGLPEFSFNVIAGAPGSGKTSLAHQIMFTTASEARPALYVTILGEPPIKMLRYQQQFAFFDTKKVTRCIHFVHLGQELLEHGLQGVLDSIVNEVERTGVKLVFVDSFRAILQKSTEPGQLELQEFVQRLAVRLTAWEATTFLIGEYGEPELTHNPVFTVADGILWLTQAVARNSIVRKLQVVKMRGQAPTPGLHTLRISDAGIRVYPRLRTPDRPLFVADDRSARRKTGVAGLDEMLGGGIPSGYSVMIVGPSGSGKTILSTQFIREGIEHGEPGVIAVFEKRPDEYLTTAPHTRELGALVKQGMLRMLYLRPLDLSVDETMEELAEAVHAIGAKRVVIDSLSGFELALAPSFREDFRESLYRMVGALVGLGITVVMTAELTDSYIDLKLSPHGISFLTDGIILQRYIELEGELRKLIAVVKMRGVAHSHALKLYDVDETGIILGEGVVGYEGLLRGLATRTIGRGK